MDRKRNQHHMKKFKKRFRVFLVIIAIIFLIAFSVSRISQFKRFFYNRSLSLRQEQITPHQMEVLLLKSPPPWMQARIEKDLMKYKSYPITRKKLDSVYRKYCNLKIARFQIQKNKLTYQTTCCDHVRFRSIKYALEEVIRLYPFLDVDFIVYFENDTKNYQDPLFVFSKDKLNHALILIPDYTCFAKETTTYAWGYSLRDKISKASALHPWHHKENLCFWRGATTGINLNHPTWESSNRCKVCTISRFHPQLINAHFTSFDEIPVQMKKHFYRNYKLSPFVTPEEHLKYKYLLCLDGNACTYPGFHWRLQSNSLVVKPQSNQIQWFYEGLVPNHHYLSVEADCANLLSKLTWATQHDELARQIAVQGTQFAEENLSQIAIYHYLIRLLAAYQDIQVTHNVVVDLSIPEYTPFF